MTFDATLADAVSRIRFDVGDFDDAAPIFAEAIYTASYARHDSDERRTAVAMAEALIRKISNDPDKLELTGSLKAEWSSRLKVLRDFANGLRSELGLPVIGATDNTMRVGYLVRGADTSSEFGG